MAAPNEAGESHSHQPTEDVEESPQGGSIYFDLDDDDDADDPDYRDEPFEEEDGDGEEEVGYWQQPGAPRDMSGLFRMMIGAGALDDDDDDEEDDGEDNEVEDEDEAEDDDEEEEEDQFEIPANAPGGLQNILRLLAAGHNASLTGAQMRELLERDDDSEDLADMLEGDDDDREFLGRGGPRRARRAPKDPQRFPKVPSQRGIELTRTGAFGSNNFDRRHKKQMMRRLLDREIGAGDHMARKRNNDLITQELVPRTQVEHIIHYDDCVYSGQFSDDGNFFFSCSQDFNVRMYDTSNPYNWKHYKTASYPWGQWTLTDASLSPDNKWLAYTSIQSMVSIAPTDPNDTGDPYTLDLSGGQPDRPNRWGWRRGGSFGIFSIRFSGDGRELVAGTNADSIVVYDIESRQVLHHIEGHDDDVNAVCFADKSSPHLIYSGSDDATIKVWDRRSMGDGREAGAFVGHIEGLTYLDSKGDGRYILSNGKDQSMKLWDLRMAMSTSDFRNSNPSRYTRRSGYDYRGGYYDHDDWDVHPHDNSVVTFRGHKVLKTLIRCHFSPPAATNSRYVYSGSADGKVYVYNMDATIASIIDVRKATLNTRQQDRRTRMYFDEPSGWATCVRDASWHPSAPVIVASAWNGYSMARGTCTMHSFNESDEDEGDPEAGQSLDCLLRPHPDLYKSSSYVPV